MNSLIQSSRNSRISVLFILTLSLLRASVASAASGELPMGQFYRMPVDSTSHIEQKSESKALRLSTFWTLVPIGAGALGVAAMENSSAAVLPGLLFVSGVIVGPSVGHFYAGRTGRGLLGIGVRTGALVGIAAITASSFSSGSSSQEDQVAVALLAVWAISSIVDIAGAPASVRKHNGDPGKPGVGFVMGPGLRGPGMTLTAQVSFF